MSLFECDTAVQAVADHRYAATVTDRWNGLAGRPLGGYVLAVCLRALREVMPVPDLFVASAFFLQPVNPGAVEIHTEIARTGRRTATGEARLYQNGAELLRTVASFTDLAFAAGQRLTTADPPDLPAPQNAIDLHDGSRPPTAPIADRVEYRVAESLEQTRQRKDRRPFTRLWMRLKEGGAKDVLSIPFLVDAAPPAVMEIGASGSTTLELTLHVRARPRSEWLACRASTSYIIDGYHEEDFEIWDRDGHLVAQSRQLAKLPKTDTLHHQHSALRVVADQLTERSNGMIQTTDLIGEYVAAWNEADPALRRSAVEALYDLDGHIVTASVDAQGIGEMIDHIDGVVAEYIGPDKYRFSQAGVERRGDCVLLRWEMVVAASAQVADWGINALVLGTHGRITADYQFVAPTWQP